MNWRRFRNELVNQYHEQPQVVALIDHACRQIEESLTILARYGHLFHLAEGPGSTFPDWPRLMFHLTAAPRGHLVFCEEDRAFLGEGWFDTLDEAKHADGMGEQFKRGGVFPKRGLPVLVSDANLTRLDQERKNGFE